LIRGSPWGKVAGVGPRPPRSGRSDSGSVKSGSGVGERTTIVQSNHRLRAVVAEPNE